MTQEKLQDQPPEHAVSKRVVAHLAHSALSGPGEARSVTSETVAFDALRTGAYAQMGQEIAHRLAANPIPTTKERLMGTYIEALEPQVRSATVALRDKGYNTVASGFHATDDNWRIMGIDNPLRTYDSSNRRGQVMDFREPFILADETKQQLQVLGAEMPEYPGLEGQVVRIGFTPTSPDLGEIKKQWNAIAQVLPDTGTPAGPRMGSVEATSFGIYCPPDVNWPMGEFDAAMAPAVTEFMAPTSAPGEAA